MIADSGIGEDETMNPSYLGKSNIVNGKVLIHDALMGNKITGSRRGDGDRQEELIVSQDGARHMAGPLDGVVFLR